MTPQKQLFLHRPEEGQFGDCWRVACLNTGRRFIGIEKDAEHFATASARIGALQREAA